MAGDESGKRVQWYNAEINGWMHLPEMIHQRAAAPAAVVAGSTLYVVGSQVNSTTIDYLKLTPTTE